MSGAWKLIFPDIVKEDFAALAVPVRAQVLKMINRVATNPLPQSRGGYGKPLGGNLSGLFKIKLRRAGVRVVYALREIDGEMVVVIVGMREGNTVYTLAAHRRTKLGL
jgi:mRNA interferase RelE/StbE